MSKLANLLKAFRILEWRGYYALFLFGFLLSEYFSIQYFFIKNILFFLYMSSIYLANNIYDRDGDLINPEKRDKNPIATCEETTFYKFSLLIITTIAFVLGCFLLSRDDFSIYIVSLIIGLYYSIPPLRFKEKPLLDLLSHSIFFGISPILFSSGLKILYDRFNLLLIIGIYSVILELRNEIEDYEYDKKAGFNTTLTKIGIRNGLIILYLLILFLYILTLKTLHHILLVIFCLLNISGFLIAVYRSMSFRKKIRILDLYLVLYLIMYLFQ